MTTGPSIPHDRRLLFLLHRASRVAIAHTNRELAKHVSVSAAQLGVLSYLVERPGCTASDLSGVLGLNKSAISGLLARLARAGFVRRETDPDDGRAARIHLTAKGERVRVASRPVWRTVARSLNSGFTDDEQEVVLRFLNEIVDRFARDLDLTRVED